LRQIREPRERIIVIVASIVGATGYTGSVLTDILSEHPGVRLGALTSVSYAGKSVPKVFPHLRVDGRYAAYSPESLAGSDVAFVCYPHAQSHAMVAELVDSGCRVVDLSADFRLKDPGAYLIWYGFDHPRPDLVEEAVEVIDDLAYDPIPSGAIAMRGYNNMYRLRFGSDACRIVYRADSKNRRIIVRAVGPRATVYSGMKR